MKKNRKNSKRGLNNLRKLSFDLVELVSIIADLAEQCSTAHTKNDINGFYTSFNTFKKLIQKPCLELNDFAEEDNVEVEVRQMERLWTSLTILHNLAQEKIEMGGLPVNSSSVYLNFCTSSTHPMLNDMQDLGYSLTPIFLDFFRSIVYFLSRIESHFIMVNNQSYDYQGGMARNFGILYLQSMLNLLNILVSIAGTNEEFKSLFIQSLSVKMPLHDEINHYFEELDIWIRKLENSRQFELTNSLITRLELQAYYYALQANYKLQLGGDKQAAMGLYKQAEITLKNRNITASFPIMKKLLAGICFQFTQGENIKFFQYEAWMKKSCYWLGDSILGVKLMEGLTSIRKVINDAFFQQIMESCQPYLDKFNVSKIETTSSIAFSLRENDKASHQLFKKKLSIANVKFIEDETNTLIVDGADSISLSKVIQVVASLHGKFTADEEQKNLTQSKNQRRKTQHRVLEETPEIEKLRLLFEKNLHSLQVANKELNDFENSKVIQLAVNLAEKTVKTHHHNSAEKFANSILRRINEIKKLKAMHNDAFYLLEDVTTNFKLFSLENQENLLEKIQSSRALLEFYINEFFHALEKIKHEHFENDYKKLQECLQVTKIKKNNPIQEAKKLRQLQHSQDAIFREKPLSKAPAKKPIKSVATRDTSAVVKSVVPEKTESTTDTAQALPPTTLTNFSIFHLSTDRTTLLSRANHHLMKFITHEIVTSENIDAHPSAQLNEMHYLIYHFRQFVISVYDLSKDNRRIARFRNSLAHYVHGLSPEIILGLMQDVAETVVKMNKNEHMLEIINTSEWYIFLLEKIIYQNGYIASTTMQVKNEEYREDTDLFRPISLITSYLDLLIENNEHYERGDLDETSKIKLYDTMLTQLIEIGEQYIHIYIKLNNDPAFSDLQSELNNLYFAFRTLRNDFMHDPTNVAEKKIANALTQLPVLRNLLANLLDPQHENEDKEEKRIRRYL